MLNLTIMSRKAKPHAYTIESRNLSFYIFTMTLYHMKVAKLTSTSGEVKAAVAWKR